ncbi:MAG: SH3 domain-containing protein [Caldilineaceae bacterium]
MKRSAISLVIVGLHLAIALFALQLPVAAESDQQTVPPLTPTPSALAQPLQLTVHQQVPLIVELSSSSPITDTVINSVTATRTNALTDTVAVADTIAVTVTLDFQVSLTDTLTATVPSSVTITFGEEQTATLPVTLTVGVSPTASVVITPLAPLTLPAAMSANEPQTPSIALTTAAGVSVTPIITTETPVTVTSEAPLPTAPAIVSTVVITSNLRQGPDTTFDVVNVLGAGANVVVVAQNADGTWYLLDNGLWIAAPLVENAPPQLPVATDALVLRLREENAARATPPATVTVTATVTATATAAVTTTVPVATPTIVATPPVTSTVSATATPTATTEAGGPILVPTPVPANATPQAAQPPRVTVDANLRAGPSTDFAVIGGTVTGQELTIVARNEDGSWFQLDNGGWVAAYLVANPPALADVPVATAAEGTSGAAINNTQTITATATPTATTVVTATTPVALSVSENLYTIRVDSIIDSYDFALTKIEGLIGQVQQDTAQLQNREWVVEMTTAITLLRFGANEVRNLTAPSLFTDAHADLAEAAANYVTAADLLAEGLDQNDVEKLDEANAEITVGNSLITRAINKIDVLTP